MVVIADSSPLHYLILIDAVHLLPALFGEVWVPLAVCRELQDRRTPPSVASFFTAPPAWLRIATVETNPEDERLLELDDGEREAITLALLHAEALLLIDESTGRRVAELRGIRFMGILGVLDRAASLGLCDLGPACQRLRRTNFRISASLIEGLIQNHLRRRPS